MKPHSTEDAQLDGLSHMLIRHALRDVLKPDQPERFKARYREGLATELLGAAYGSAEGTCRRAYSLLRQGREQECIELVQTLLNAGPSDGPDVATWGQNEAI